MPTREEKGWKRQKVVRSGIDTRVTPPVTHADIRDVTSRLEVAYTQHARTRTIQAEKVRSMAAPCLPREARVQYGRPGAIAVPRVAFAQSTILLTKPRGFFDHLLLSRDGLDQ